MVDTAGNGNGSAVFVAGIDAFRSAIELGNVALAKRIRESMNKSSPTVETVIQVIDQLADFPIEDYVSSPSKWPSITGITMEDVFDWMGEKLKTYYYDDEEFGNFVLQGTARISLVEAALRHNLPLTAIHLIGASDLGRYFISREEFPWARELESINTRVLELDTNRLYAMARSLVSFNFGVTARGADNRELALSCAKRAIAETRRDRLKSLGINAIRELVLSDFRAGRTQEGHELLEEFGGSIQQSSLSGLGKFYIDLAEAAAAAGEWDLSAEIINNILKDPAFKARAQILAARALRVKGAEA